MYIETYVHIYIRLYKYMYYTHIYIYTCIFTYPCIVHTIPHILGDTHAATCDSTRARSDQDLMELFCARQRRKFSRGIKRACVGLVRFAEITHWNFVDSYVDKHKGC